MKGALLLGRKAVTNLDSILKRRDITLPTEVRLVKAMVFPVVMDGCEMAEHRRTDAFKLWGWNLLQYFGVLVPRADSLEKTQMLGKTEGRRRSR